MKKKPKYKEMTKEELEKDIQERIEISRRMFETPEGQLALKTAHEHYVAAMTKEAKDLAGNGHYIAKIKIAAMKKREEDLKKKRKKK